MINIDWQIFADDVDYYDVGGVGYVVDVGNIDYDVDFVKDLFFLWFGAHEASKEGDKLSIASPNWDLTRRLVEARILQVI